MERWYIEFHLESFDVGLYRCQIHRLRSREVEGFVMSIDIEGRLILEVKIELHIRSLFGVSLLNFEWGGIISNGRVKKRRLFIRCRDWEAVIKGLFASKVRNWVDFWFWSQGLMVCSRRIDGFDVEGPYTDSISRILFENWCRGSNSISKSILVNVDMWFLFDWYK